MIPSLQMALVLRFSFNGVTRKTQNTFRPLDLSLGRHAVTRVQFSSGPGSMDQTPTPKHSNLTHLSSKDLRSGLLPGSISVTLVAAMKSKASESREQRSLDSALETYFQAKISFIAASFHAAQSYLYNQLTKPTRPKSSVEDEQTYEEFVERLPWPNTDLELRQAFHDDLGPYSWWKQPRQIFLKLYNAEDPDPAPFLDYCDGISTVSERGKGSNLKKQINWKLRTPCRDAIVILRHKGLLEDARWLNAFASYNPKDKITNSVSPRPQSVESLESIYKQLGVNAHLRQSRPNTEQSQEASKKDRSG